MEIKPQLVTKEYYYGQPKYTLNYNVEEHDGVYDYNTVELQPYEFGYSEFVSAMLKERYGDDGIEAATNNYLANLSDMTIAKDYMDIQLYRGQCKVWAREMLRYCVDNNIAIDDYADTFDALENTRGIVLQKIANYDISTNVNSFSLGGVDVWLTKPQRESLLTSLNMFKMANVDVFPFVLGGRSMELPVQTIEQMLAAIEVYATQCMMITAMHKADVSAMENEEQLLAYDITSGYPAKVVFDL